MLTQMYFRQILDNAYNYNELLDNALNRLTILNEVPICVVNSLFLHLKQVS